MKKTFVQGSNTGASSVPSRFAVGLRKLLAAGLLVPLVAFAQSYPSPTFNNLTVQGTFTLSGGLPPASLAAQAANTVLANVTASSASPTAVALPSCSTANSALKYTSATGFSCGTTYALTSGTLAQFAATTSAQLAGIISDETGSGSLVFGTSPTIASPTFPNGLTVSGGTITGVSGRLINVQVFSASGTYTPTVGATSAVVEEVGGGGGSGGVAATGASTISISGGGGSGAYGKIRITGGLSSQTVTIGAAGTAGAVGANSGGTGGTTSFGTLISCPGGTGSTGGTALPPPLIFDAGKGGSTCTGTGVFLVKSQGQTGGFPIAAGNGNAVSGAGAPSVFGGGAPFVNTTASAGTAAVSPGSGAGGAIAQFSQAAQAGGAGAAGLVVVWEYQ